MTAATCGASTGRRAPVPQPRSPTVHVEGSSASSAERDESSPKSSARSRSHSPADAAKNCCDAALRPASTRASRRASCSTPGRPASWPLTISQSSPRPGAGGRGERVVPARAVTAGTDPTGVRQHLQVAADRRLRKLQHVAELPDGQLLGLQEPQHPAPGRVRQGGERVEKGKRRDRHISVNPDVMIFIPNRFVKPGPEPGTQNGERGTGTGNAGLLSALDRIFENLLRHRQADLAGGIVDPALGDGEPAAAGAVLFVQAA